MEFAQFLLEKSKVGQYTKSNATWNNVCEILGRKKYYFKMNPACGDMFSFTSHILKRV